MADFPPLGQHQWVIGMPFAPGKSKTLDMVGLVLHASIILIAMLVASFIAFIILYASLLTNYFVLWLVLVGIVILGMVLLIFNRCPFLVSKRGKAAQDLALMLAGFTTFLALADVRFDAVLSRAGDLEAQQRNAHALVKSANSSSCAETARPLCTLYAEADTVSQFVGALNATQMTAIRDLLKRIYQELHIPNVEASDEKIFSDIQARTDISQDAKLVVANLINYQDASSQLTQLFGGAKVLRRPAGLRALFSDGERTLFGIVFAYIIVCMLFGRHFNYKAATA